MEHILPENRSNYNNKLSKCFKTSIILRKKEEIQCKDHHIETQFSLAVSFPPKLKLLQKTRYLRYPIVKFKVNKIYLITIPFLILLCILTSEKYIALLICFAKMDFL
jgi:hypothetical protein